MAVRSRNLKYLHDYLSERSFNGKLNLPPSSQTPMPREMLYTEYKGIVSRPVLQSNKEDVEKLKENGFRFYQRGPLPKAIMMDRVKPGDKLYSVMKQEIDRMTDSNNSLIFHDQATGDFAGLCLNSTWKTDKNYDAFPVNPVEWLNTAGEIANEKAADDDEAMAIWRDFLWQLYYHLYQWQAQLQKKDIIFSYNAMEIEPAYLNRKFAPYASLAIQNNRPSNVLIGGYTTVQGGRAGFKKYLTNFKEYHYIPYKYITFERNGKPVFAELWDREGVSYQATFL